MDKTAQHRTALGRESEERIEVFFFTFSLSFFSFLPLPLASLLHFVGQHDSV